MYDVNFIEPKSDSEKRQELIESINRYSDKRLSNGQKEVLKRAIQNLPNILDAQQLFDWLTIARADSFNFDYTPVYSNSKIAVLKNSEILNGCINPKINEATGQRDYLNENKLIIGDNFDALNNLLLTHKGKIDVIYIDPPYNTDSMKNDGNHADERLLETLDQKTEDGKSKFIYNDSFYRDDWLSMMKLRLEKAKKLMSAGGVIFVSIDDSEQAYLKVLMDEIFGEENFIETFLWNKTQTPPSLSTKTRTTFEYIHCYQKKKNNHKMCGWTISGGDAPLFNESNKYSELEFPKNSVITSLPNGIYPKHKFDNHELLDDVVVNNGIIVNSFKLAGKFRWTQNTLLEELKNGTTIIVKSSNFSPRYTRNDQRNVTPTDLIDLDVIINKTKKVGTYESGTKENINIFKEKNFSFAKPVSLIKYLIKICNFSSNITVLDFFAGSGTTGQAVMDLNKEDGGNRKFILCTNNQNKIGETVCAERLYRIITGKTSDGKSDFDWIKNNEAYSNESVGIYETKITDLDFDPEVSNVKSIQDLGNDAIRVYSQFSNEIINENVFNALTTLPIIERKED